MTTVFVYEYVTAIGARGDEPLAPSLLAEGRAMRDAVIADFAAISGIIVLTISGEDEAQFRQVAAESDFALVIAPEMAGILEERCRWALEAGTTLLGPALDAIQLTSDKLALAEHFERERVPHPRTWPLGNEPLDLFPIVWKPRDGAGSQGTHLLYSSWLAGGAAHHPPIDYPRQAGNYIAQEYIAGIAASVSFLIGAEVRVPLLPCRQHISNDGRLRYLGGSLPLPAELASRAIQLVEKVIAVVPGLLGYVGVDLVLADDPANDSVIEVNPRLTTSYVGLRQAAQFNIADALLNAVCGAIQPDLPWHLGPIAWLPNGAIDHTDGY
jgi:predicted ATP-grasp superfamily ATP-dependent carboligase